MSLIDETLIVSDTEHRMIIIGKALICSNYADTSDRGRSKTIDEFGARQSVLSRI